MVSELYIHKLSFKVHPSLSLQTCVNKWCHSRSVDTWIKMLSFDFPLLQNDYGSFIISVCSPTPVLALSLSFNDYLSLTHSLSLSVFRSPFLWLSLSLFFTLSFSHITSLTLLRFFLNCVSPVFLLFLSRILSVNPSIFFFSLTVFDPTSAFLSVYLPHSYECVSVTVYSSLSVSLSLSHPVLCLSFSLSVYVIMYFSPRVNCFRYMRVSSYIYICSPLYRSACLYNYILS